MACREQCSMRSMRVQVQMKVHLHLQVQCIVYTVRCVGCSVLPAKDEDLEVETE